VTGTFVNAAAILGGCLVAWTMKTPSAASQGAWKIFLGLFAIYAGLSATWESLHGPFPHGFKQMAIALLAMMLGNLTGRTLRLQHALNRLGQYARDRVMSVGITTPRRANEAFLTCTILFCGSPIGMVGALQDGLLSDWKTLALKAAMDGLACLSFGRQFGATLLLAVLPLFAWQGTISLGAMVLARSLPSVSVDAVGVTAGLIVFSISLVIFEAKKIALADYLPSLIYAPLLAWAWS